MKVYVTLDKMDGSQSRLKGPINLDEIDLHGMLFFLTQSDVAGVSFVRADVLRRLDRINPAKERALVNQALGGAVDGPVEGS